jgi:hypothetical protein
VSLGVTFAASVNASVALYVSVACINCICHNVNTFVLVRLVCLTFVSFVLVCFVSLQTPSVSVWLVVCVLVSVVLLLVCFVCFVKQLMTPSVCMIVLKINKTIGCLRLKV